MIDVVVLVLEPQAPHCGWREIRGKAIDLNVEVPVRKAAQ